MAVRVRGMLEQEYLKALNNADQPDVLAEVFAAVSNATAEYFNASLHVTQSNEVKNSQRRFCWRWVELPQFPLRKFVPLIAQALKRFPHYTGLVLVCADLCSDICKQNVIAKLEAMQCGVVQGLCLAAGQLAVSALSRQVTSDDTLLANRIFEGLLKVVETASIQFYSLTLAIKEEFYAIEKAAWAEVDIADTLKALEEAGRLGNMSGGPPAHHALVLTLYFLKTFPKETNPEHYLQVVRNLAEAFDNTFPTVLENAALQSFLKDVLVQSIRPGGERYTAWLIEDAMLIYTRTLRLSDIPWDHRTPCLSSSLRASFDSESNAPLKPVSWQVGQYNSRRREPKEILVAKARELINANMREERENRKCVECSKVQRDRLPGEPVFKKCSRCQGPDFYCGAACQKLQWKQHKKVCRPP